MKTDAGIMCSAHESHLFSAIGQFYCLLNITDDTVMCCLPRLIRCRVVLSCFITQEVYRRVRWRVKHLTPGGVAVSVWLFWLVYFLCCCLIVLFVISSVGELSSPFLVGLQDVPLPCVLCVYVPAGLKSTASTCEIVKRGSDDSCLRRSLKIDFDCTVSVPARVKKQTRTNWDTLTLLQQCEKVSVNVVDPECTSWFND